MRAPLGRNLITPMWEGKVHMTEGNNRTLALVNAFAGPGRYADLGAPIVHFDADDKDGLWEQLIRSLLDTIAERRMARRAPGRPAKGPGSERLGADEAERVKQVRDAYDYVAEHNHGHASYAGVARRLQISPTTLWRIRSVYGWPPTVPPAVGSA